MAQKKQAPAQRPLLMTAAQMAQVSGIGETTLRALMSKRELEFLAIGSKKLIAESAVWDYYDRHKSTVEADMNPSAVFLRKRA